LRAPFTTSATSFRRATVKRAGAVADILDLPCQHDIVGFWLALVGGLSSRMQHFVGQASIAAQGLGRGSTPAGIVEAEPAGGSGSDVFPAGHVVLCEDLADQLVAAPDAGLGEDRFERVLTVCGDKARALAICLVESPPCTAGSPGTCALTIRRRA
jgi:hypothetical protein